jgi:hypothetical protein
LVVHAGSLFPSKNYLAGMRWRFHAPAVGTARILQRPGFVGRHRSNSERNFDRLALQCVQPDELFDQVLDIAVQHKLQWSVIEMRRLRIDQCEVSLTGVAQSRAIPGLHSQSIARQPIST